MLILDAKLFNIMYKNFFVLCPGISLLQALSRRLFFSRPLFSFTPNYREAGSGPGGGGGGGGGTPYNGLYGEAPPERGTFFSLKVYKRVGISQV